MSLASNSSRSSTQSSLHTPTSRPMSIASTSSPRNSFSCSTTNPYSSCAYPSWRSGSALRKNGTPSSYVSDEDLFGDDDDEPYLSEPPPPPRPAEVWMAKPLLPPVYPVKSRKSSHSSSHNHKKKRHSSSAKPKE
ncbi:hypothetical protein PRZ48_014135 [Zasmidium cellare]|uniref:Uncharacterized protein n=1 Tax=Zasmidium cellare TaxID=395010 RepID=A0ABR0E047_ZASCE|nr:hypothetical protein PRZ48_014135 [Zasmidium cellare]